AARVAADAERAIQPDGPAGNDGDRGDVTVSPELHDGALAELLLDRRDRGGDRLQLLAHLCHATPPPAGCAGGREQEVGRGRRDGGGDRPSRAPVAGGGEGGRGRGSAGGALAGGGGSVGTVGGGAREGG